MAGQVKLSIKRGQHSSDVVVAAGAVIAGSDALFVNIDVTSMSRTEVCNLLDEVRRQILEKGWPQL